MCIANIFNLFKKPDIVIGVVSSYQKLLHPEESFDPEQTLMTNPYPVRSKWLVDWKVPMEHWLYWQGSTSIYVRNTGYSGLAYVDGKDTYHLDIQPGMVNPGLLAHEHAHLVWLDHLTEEQREAFANLHNELLDTSEIIKALYSLKPYGLDELKKKKQHIEGHAEIYRYLGEKMPEILEQFYPKLI